MKNLSFKSVVLIVGGALAAVFILGALSGCSQQPNETNTPAVTQTPSETASKPAEPEAVIAPSPSTESSNINYKLWMLAQNDKLVAVQERIGKLLQNNRLNDRDWKIDIQKAITDYFDLAEEAKKKIDIPERYREVHDLYLTGMKIHTDYLLEVSLAVTTGDWSRTDAAMIQQGSEYIQEATQRLS